MAFLVEDYNGLFQALCQLSATWFAFGFISKNEMKENEKKKKKNERKKNVKAFWKIKNENKRNRKN